MKFLHISDLHIGKIVNGVSMLEEQRHVLAQIIDCVKTVRPLAVIIAGDVYDRTVPSVEAVGEFDDFLTRLANEDVVVMLISGNHDSPNRLTYASRLLEDKKLFLHGAFDVDGGVKNVMRKVALKDEQGNIFFWLLPYIKPVSLRAMFDDDADVKIETHEDAVFAVIDNADVDYSARNVLVSHQFYVNVNVGVEPTRCESETNTVGGLDAVDTAIVERFDYVALGHLHGAQSVGAKHIRYCGSPLKYSFSESAHKKSISIIELGAKGEAIKITEHPLTPLHDMRKVKGNIEKLISDEVLISENKNNYLHVTLTDDEWINDPMSKLRSVYPNIMSLAFENSRTSINIDDITAETGEVETLSPYELFTKFFRETQGIDMSGEQAKIVRELLEKGGDE